MNAKEYSMQLNENIKITVLVTVHNSEKYLKQCLESVCKQSFKEIEVLCIDGGSTDTSPEILKAYQRHDSRIRIINDPNTSYGHKINIGIIQARGDYIGILESDDRMKESMLEQLYYFAQKYDLDYVDANYDTFFEIDGKTFYYEVKKYNTQDCYNKLMNSAYNAYTLKGGATGAIWTGIYKRSFLLHNSIHMFESPGAAYQDTSFRFLVCALAGSCYHLSETLHEYRSDNTESSIKDNSKIFAISMEYDYLKEQLIERKLFSNDILDAYYQWKYQSYYWNTFRLPTDAREQFLKKYRTELSKDIEQGHLIEDSLSKSDYQNTFMLISDPKAFMESIAKHAQDGNLSFQRIFKAVKEIGSKKIVVFGFGIRGKHFLNLYQNYSDQILCLCDNNADLHYKKIMGYTLLPVADSFHQYPDATFVIANSKNHTKMKEQLIGLGVCSENICIF